MAKPRPTEIVAVPVPWQDIVLVCRHCGDAGFGKKGKDALPRVLKQAIRAGGQRGRIGVVKVDCFGICPKRAVTVALASQPGTLLVIPEGETGSKILERLDPNLMDRRAT